MLTYGWWPDEKKNGSNGGIVRFILIFVVIFYTALAGAGDLAERQSEFDQFRNESNDFQAYKRSVHEEFEQYKRIVAEEFTKYKHDMLGNGVKSSFDS